MTKKTSINPDPHTAADVWQFYENMRDSMVQMREQTKRNRVLGLSGGDPRFFAMNFREIDEIFQENLEEIEQQACLFLIAAAEAAFGVDFLQRVYGRGRDGTSRQFRDIYKRRNHSRLNIKLQDDILDIWAQEVPASKSHIGNFKGTLNYRHWLAHGRYWVPKLGARYDPAGILNIILAVFDKIGLDED